MGDTLYGAAIGLFKDKGVYLSRRIDTPLFPKKWQFLNGGMKDGENGHNSSIRIAEEQTGIKLDDSRLHYITSINITQTNEFYFVYLVYLKNAEIPVNNCPKHCSDWKLFTLDAAVVLDLVPGVRHILLKLNKALHRVELEIKVKDTDGEETYI